MASLNIKFSGLFLWVPDKKTNTMYVLAPPTINGAYVVEQHVTRLLLPGSPQLYDIGRMDLQIGGSGITTVPSLSKNFDCSRDGGEVDVKLLTGNHGSNELQNRFVLRQGEYSSEHAPVEFYIGGTQKQCIASEIMWKVPLDASGTIRLLFMRLDMPAPALPPIDLQSINGADINIEVHHVPESHLPGMGMHHDPVKPFQLARHLPALYNLMVNYRTIVIPLTSGGSAHMTALAGPAGGGDPVTCGGGTASMP